MVGVAALEAEPGLAGVADRVLGHALLGLDDDITVGTRAEPQVGVTPKGRHFSFKLSELNEIFAKSGAKTDSWLNKLKDWTHLT